MNEAYHYPANLLNTLARAIVVLNKSKIETINFFRSAGVSKNYLVDLQKQVKTDKDSIKKIDITRTVLIRINELGDSAIRIRREIIKRVVEFESFSSCWPKNQYEAKGLVAEVREIVNKKDSFTRMKNELDKERKQARLEKEKEHEEIVKSKTAIEKIKKELFPLFGMENKQKRGKKLEVVINNLFKIYGVLVKESFSLAEDGVGIYEQIDGAIEIDGHIYLVEIKWLEDNVGVEHFSSFINRIYARGSVRGIFISASDYTKPFIKSCKAALDKKVVILCRLEEIVNLLNNDNDLIDFFKKKINSAQVETNPYYKILN